MSKANNFPPPRAWQSPGESSHQQSPQWMISTHQLCKYYGQFAAIIDISLQVPSRQICGLLGPNGAGKSTTMKLLTGLLSPTSGSVHMAGFDMQTDRIAASEQIGYLPENGPLYLEMTPRSTLEYLAQTRGLSSALRRNRLEFVADKCALTEVWNKPIGKLSRGFRQRVGMAQALLHDPAILILDEPTSGLDPNQLVGVRQLIRHLGQEKTVVLSTHVLQEVEELCDRVVLINEGRMIFDGPLEQLGRREDMEQRFHQLTGFSPQPISA